MARLAFRVLGPLEVARDGCSVKLGGERQHALLALLLLSANEVVPSEQILEELFRDVARDPANALQVAISRLRRTLGDGVLETRPRGYLLCAGQEELDSALFERWGDEGRRRLAAGEPDVAAEVLRAALGLWRGSPFQEVALFDFAQPAIRRLEALRLTAEMDRLDAELALGHAVELVPELERLVTANPLQERLRGQLMLALYRCGRQAEALETYRATRELLRDELGLEPSRALQRLEHAILNQDVSLEQAAATVGHAAVCPFKGLAAYEVDDADYFCGRERLVAELVARLASSSFVGIVGPSGSGKSSLLRAGLLPALHAGALPGSNGWRVVAIRPGDPIDPAARLIAVDQLEEVFAWPDAERAAFLDALVEAAERARVLVCVRADFYGRCAEHRSLADLLGRSQVLVGPMEADELRRAVETPAARGGLEVERPLVDALVAEAEGQPGALPLLSTTLLELWRLRGDNVLRYETYQAAGGIEGAVARLAEQTYRQLTASEREAARRILLRLADEGPEAPVRRRVPLAELARDEEEDTLAKLTAARLVTVSDGAVEVAHEALLREWPRLRDWLDADVEGRRIHRELSAQANAWESGDRDDADLYRGARLAAAVEWASAHPSDPAEIERAFLVASRRAAQRALTRLRAVAAVLGVLLAVAVAGGIVAVAQRQSARQDARVALATRLGAQAIAEPRLDRALLLAREALHLEDSPQTEDALLATLLRSPALVASYVLPEGVRPYRLVVSPDGRTLAVGDSRGALRFFDTRRRIETRPVFGRVFGFGPTVYTPGGAELLALASSLRGLVVRDARTLREDRFLRFDEHFQPERTGAVTPLAVGANAAFFSYDLIIDRQNDEGPAFLDRWQLATGRRTSVRLGSPDVLGAGLVGANLVTVTSRLIETWDGRTLRRLRALRVPVRLGGYAAVDSRGRYAVALEHLAPAILFVDLRSGRVTPASGADATGGVLSVGFTPDGRYAVTTGTNGDVTLWDPSTGDAIDTFAGHAGAANSAAFSPDGKTLYASSLDGTILAWAIDHGRRFGNRFTIPSQPRDLPHVPQTPPLALVGGDAIAVRESTGVAECPLRTLVCRALPRSAGAFVTVLAANGATLAVGRSDGSVELRSPGRPARRLTGLPGSVQSIAFAPSAARVAAAGLHALALWDAASGARTGLLQLPTAGTAVAIGPDGRRLAVGLADGRVLVTTVGGGDTRTLRPHGSPNLSVAFLPDGTLLTGSYDGALERWSAADGRRLAAAASAPTGPVASIVVAPDGRTVLTSSLTTGTIREWSAAHLQLLAEFPGDPFSLTNVAITPNGGAAIAVFDSGNGIVWPLRLGDWEERACRIAGRNLTPSEWQQFLPGRSYAAVCPL
jgi:DNA-binding SARP family transcriptional activator/WD40 repeat protein/energy-coupling factor transporter ATP-binding protein EcfA2